MIDATTRSPSRTLFALSAAFLAAVFAHSWYERQLLGASAWLAVCGALLAGAVLARYTGETWRSRSRLITLAAFVVSLALWRYDAALPSLHVPLGAEYRGTVAREPVTRDGRTRLSAVNVTADGGPARPLFITARSADGVREGDDIVWRCLPPRADDDGKTWEGFCTADGAVVSVGRRSHPFLRLRSELRAVARSLLPEPDSSLLLGLLVGDRGGLPTGLTDAFRATGTSHVLAVSGYNVMLVIEALIVSFALLGLARRKAAAVVAAGVAGFVLLAGADPPVLRAGLMGSAGLLAALLGRKPHGTNAFVLAAALMLFADPLALRHDVSFRLSFFAVAGLSAFGTPFERLFAFIPLEPIRAPLAQTLGATLATLPIALYDFGSLALASPFTNVMIAPLVPFATAVGAVAVIAGFASPWLAFLPAASVALALRLMRLIVGWWAEWLPALEFRTGFVATLALYVSLLFLWRLLKTGKPYPQKA